MDGALSWNVLDASFGSIRNPWVRSQSGRKHPRTGSGEVGPQLRKGFPNSTVGHLHLERGQLTVEPQRQDQHRETQHSLPLSPPRKATSLILLFSLPEIK